MVFGKDPSTAFAALTGIRYTILIGSAEKYIYRVGHAWYVMA